MTLILGIDPGLRTTGYGLVDATDARVLRFVDQGCVHSGNGSLAERLMRIHTDIDAIIVRHPDVRVMAIEDVFLARSFQSVLRLGQARGVAILAAARHGVEIASYSPRQVKKAVTGAGAADKQQIQHMVKVLIDCPDQLAADAADALAVAICHAHFSQTRKRLRNMRSTGKNTHPEDPGA